MALLAGGDDSRTRYSYSNTYLSRSRVTAATSTAPAPSSSNLRAALKTSYSETFSVPTPTCSSLHSAVSRTDNRPTLPPRPSPSQQPPPPDPDIARPRPPSPVPAMDMDIEPSFTGEKPPIPFRLPYVQLTHHDDDDDDSLPCVPPPFPGLFRSDIHNLPPTPPLTHRSSSPSALPTHKHPLPPPPRRSPHQPSPFPHPLPKVTQLTPHTLHQLSTLLTTLPQNPLQLIFPCTPDQLSTLLSRFSQLLEKKLYFNLWEYHAPRGGRGGEFVIKCTPSPIHENFMAHGTWQWVQGIGEFLGRRERKDIRVVANTKLTTEDSATNTLSRWIPDLTVGVVPYTAPESASDATTPGEAGDSDSESSLSEESESESEDGNDTDDRYIYGIIFEVGFTQSLRSLKNRARVWLDNGDTNPTTATTATNNPVTNKGTHLAVLIHISEQPQTYRDPDTEEVLPPSKVAERKFAWPREWFSGRGPWEEVCARRSNARGHDPEEELTRIKEELQREIVARLVSEDKKVKGKKRRVIPALLEPLDAAVYVYRRKPAGMDSDDGGNAVEGVGVKEEEEAAKETEAVDNAVVITEEGVVMQEVMKKEVVEDAEGLVIEESVQGGGGDHDHDHDRDDSTTDAEAEEEFVLGEEYFRTEGDAEYDSSSSTPSFPSLSSAATTTTRTRTPSTISSSSSSDNDNDENLELIYTHPLLTHSRLAADLASQRLQFSLAELYGPLPSPTQALPPDADDDIPDSVLALIPPDVRPHAKKRVVFPLEGVAESLLRNKTGMRVWRAEGRAGVIMDRAWGEVKRRLKEEELGGQQAPVDGDGGVEGGAGAGRGRKRRKDKHGQERLERWVKRAKRKRDEEGREGDGNANGNAPLA